MIALILAAAVAAASSQQFDLICTGTSKAADGGVKPFRARYSLDLRARRVCLVECESPGTLGVTADEFDLSPEHEGTVEYMHIDRNTGHYLAHTAIKSIGYSVIDEADCKRAKFSGFPQRKF